MVCVCMCVFFWGVHTLDGKFSTSGLVIRRRKKFLAFLAFVLIFYFIFSWIVDSFRVYRIVVLFCFEFLVKK